jgi:hypothetical protein
MSSLNASDIGELVRRRFNGPEGDELRYIPLVDSALRQLAYDVAKDPGMRSWLLSDPTTAIATLDANGIADLTPLIENSPRILLECLCYGDVHPDPSWASQQPLRQVPEMGQGLLAGAYDGLIYHYWLEGYFLNTRSPDNNATPLVGTISFRTPRWPTLAELPEALVQKLVWGNYWVTGEQKSENAAA